MKQGIFNSIDEYRKKAHALKMATKPSGDFEKIFFTAEFIRDFRNRLDLLMNYLVRKDAFESFQFDQLEDIGALIFGLVLGSWDGSTRIEKDAKEYSGVDWAISNSKVVVIGQAKRHKPETRSNHDNLTKFHSVSDTYRKNEHRDKVAIYVFFFTGTVTVPFNDFFTKLKKLPENNTLFLFGRSQLSALMTDVLHILQVFPINLSEPIDEVDLFKRLSKFQRKILSMLNGKSPYKELSYINKSDMAKAMIEVRRNFRRYSEIMNNVKAYSIKKEEKLSGTTLKSAMTLSKLKKVYVLKKHGQGYVCKEILTIGKPTKPNQYPIINRVATLQYIDKKWAQGVHATPENTVCNFTISLLSEVKPNS